jgi:acyl-coenzyme A thioesterase 13
MKGASTGDTILIDANTLRVGRTMAFLSVDVRNKETGQLLAQGRHTKHIGTPSS